MKTLTKTLIETLIWLLAAMTAFPPCVMADVTTDMAPPASQAQGQLNFDGVKDAIQTGLDVGLSSTQNSLGDINTKLRGTTVNLDCPKASWSGCPGLPVGWSSYLQGNTPPSSQMSTPAPTDFEFTNLKINSLNFGNPPSYTLDPRQCTQQTWSKDQTCRVSVNVERLNLSSNILITSHGKVLFSAKGADINIDAAKVQATIRINAHGQITPDIVQIDPNTAIASVIPGKVGVDINGITPRMKADAAISACKTLFPDDPAKCENQRTVEKAIADYYNTEKAKGPDAEKLALQKIADAESPATAQAISPLFSNPSLTPQASERNADAFMAAQKAFDSAAGDANFAGVLAKAVSTKILPELIGQVIDPVISDEIQQLKGIGQPLHESIPLAQIQQATSAKDIEGAVSNQDANLAQAQAYIRSGDATSAKNLVVRELGAEARYLADAARVSDQTVLAAPLNSALSYWQTTCASISASQSPAIKQLQPYCSQAITSLSQAVQAAQTNNGQHIDIAGQLMWAKYNEAFQTLDFRIGMTANCGAIPLPAHNFPALGGMPPALSCPLAVQVATEEMDAYSRQMFNTYVTGPDGKPTNLWDLKINCDASGRNCMRFHFLAPPTFSVDARGRLNINVPGVRYSSGWIVQTVNGSGAFSLGMSDYQQGVVTAKPIASSVDINTQFNSSSAEDFFWSVIGSMFGTLFINKAKTQLTSSLGTPTLAIPSDLTRLFTPQKVGVNSNGVILCGQPHFEALESNLK